MHSLECTRIEQIYNGNNAGSMITQNMINNAVHLITIQRQIWEPKWASGCSEREYLVVRPRANEGQRRSNIYKSTRAALAPDGPVRHPGAKDHFTLNSQILQKKKNIISPL